MRETRAYCCFVDENMKNREDSVVLLCFAYHRNQNINNKETRQETKAAVVFFGLFTVKKRKTILDFRKQKENHRIGGRDFCYCFTGSPSFTPPIETNRSRNPSRKRRLLCLSFPVLSSLFCVRAAARRQKRDGETEERDGRQGIFCASFGYSPSSMLKTKR